jgi:hypothetical protein
MLSCQSRGPDQALRIETLFGGYGLILICADDLPQNIRIQDIEASRLRNTYPDDRVLVPGRVYVFQMSTDTLHETLAIAVLPKRLVAAGATVTKAPKTSEDLIDLYVGGPLFLIEFEKDGHHGTIFNKVDTLEPIAKREKLLVAFR